MNVCIFYCYYFAPFFFRTTKKQTKEEFYEKEILGYVIFLIYWGLQLKSWGFS